MSIPRPPPNESWDCMLPGPPSRNNFGSADISPSGLLAFPSGSSISILDCRSMQLITTLPMPPSNSVSVPATNSVSPFVTAVRWTPSPLRRDLLSTEPSTSHLLLAAADRQGRIALLDFRLKYIALWFDTDHASAKLGVQDLCWVQSKLDTYILVAIIGPSMLSVFNSVTGHCIWKYDAYPEVFSCIRRDPFDSRQFCALGLKGFLLWGKVHGENDDDVAIKDYQIRTDCTELQRLERDAGGGVSSSPASAVYPLYQVKFAFSPQWRHIMFVTFPRELVVFDLQYETVLFSAALPRGCSKFLDVLPDPDSELLYCAHLDGRLSTWRRKGDEQVHQMCAMEELMPLIGSSVPSPTMLSVIVFQSNSILQNIGKIYSDSDGPHSSDPDVDFYSPFDLCDESLLAYKTHLISISDDGKIWKWLLTAERIGDSQKDVKNTGVVADASDVPVTRTSIDIAVSSSDGLPLEYGQQRENARGGRGNILNNILTQTDLSFKWYNLVKLLCYDCTEVRRYPPIFFSFGISCLGHLQGLSMVSLVGQLQLLSSTVTMLAVPSPSLTATLARGGNYPAVAVPLVALGTQNGTIDIVDVSANAVAASFSAHNGIVRGLRWLGNSRLVSFSYNQVSEKTGGYTNRLVVTCLRSGINRPFRVLQKPERAPIRALRASSSGRYLLIMFRDSPVEVWAMTKIPIMLRSLALPFTVLEWTLPTVPRPVQNGPVRQSSLSSKDHDHVSPDEGSSPTASDSKNSDGPHDDSSESFAFALVNGALGVFEVHGRRIRDYRPKWPSTSFVSSDGLITAMAYRLPHVVMGDGAGNIRWWDVTTGYSSSFHTHREGIRRIKFSPTVAGDCSRSRIAVLFYDNTFSVFDLDSPDPLASAFVQPQIPGTLVLELDWLPLRTEKSDPLVLCMAGADSSFRLVEVIINDKKLRLQRKSMKERFRPMPLCAPILFPTPHALALRMILQLGVKPSWFNTCSTVIDKRPHLITGTTSATSDLRSYMIDSPPVGDTVVPEMLLKVLDPYRKEGCILDDDNARLYATVVNKGCAARFAFAAAIFGESSEALFWLQLPHALDHLMNKSVNKAPLKPPVSALIPEQGDTTLLSRITSKENSEPETRKTLNQVHLSLMAFEQEELWESASKRIPWHEKLEGEEAIQNRVHELVSIGNLEVAVSLLLSTPPESSYFYPNALRAVALSSAVSRSLHELAVKVVAANMVRTDRSLSGTHLLSAVGRYQEACSQLQDAGCWTDAATLAATHLKGSDYARVLQRWADYVLRTEHNIWRALILYVAAGALQEALAALREAHHPDTAAMFILACREIHAEIILNLENSKDESTSINKTQMYLPGFNPENEDVLAVGEYFGEYQRKLVHFCMDSQPYSD